MTSSADAREALVASLRRDVARLEARRPPDDERAISTGSPALDRLLPAGGLRPGTLVEYLTASTGSGAGTLALAAARQACREGRALVVLDWVVGTLRVPSSGNGTPTRYAGAPVPTTYFYPPAAAAWGIDLSAMLVLRPTNEADALWAVDQALRCPGVGAVWAACDRLDVRDFRRLQLAAECGGTLGLLLRPARLRGQPTWADVQWEVFPLPLPLGEATRCVGTPGEGFTKADLLCYPRKRYRPHPNPLPKGEGMIGSQRHSGWQIHVELVRCRGGTGGKVVILELDERAGIWREVSDEATHTMPVSAPVADPIRHGRTRRA